jgi:hypothetical protein
LLEPLARLGVRQEEVPQARLARLGLGRFKQLQLPRVPRPAIRLLLVQRLELLLPGRDILFEVLLHPLEKRLRFFRHGQVEKLGIQLGHGPFLCCLCFLNPLCAASAQRATDR